LKVWWSLRAHGRKAYAKVIDNLFALAAYMEKRIQSEPTLKMMAPVTLTAVCFCCRNISDSGNERVLSRLVSEGTAFLGKACVNGKLCLRACFLNLRSTMEDVDLVLERVKQLGLEEPPH